MNPHPTLFPAAPALPAPLLELIREQARMVKRSPVRFTAERAAQNMVSRHCSSDEERAVALSELAKEVIR